MMRRLDDGFIACYATPMRMMSQEFRRALYIYENDDIILHETKFDIAIFDSF